MFRFYGAPQIAYSRDGSGTYSLPQAAFVAGTTIESAKVNSNFSDIASALTASLAKDGQTVPTANLPMGGYKLTGLARGTGTGDSIRYDEFKHAFRSHLVGCTLSNNSGSPNTKIDVAAGAWTEDGQSTVYSLSAATIDCSTTGANGLDAGSLANSTFYHVYAIGKTDGTSAVLASTSASSPTMPSGYTLKRRIGAVCTNGSAQILSFTQSGDYFLWGTARTSINANAPGTSAVNRTLDVPGGVNVEAFGTFTLTNLSAATGAQVTLSDIAQTAFTTSQVPNTGNTAALVVSSGSTFRIRTNTSAQIRSQVSGLGDANVTLVIVTQGWYDRRGRDT